MTSTLAIQPEPQALTACTISRDVEAFDLLIEDMEALRGESWGDLSIEDALAFLEQPEAETLEFVAMALDSEDEVNTPLLIDIIAAAKAKGIAVVVIAEDVRPATLHQLLREGADEFVPYPLPEGELGQAVERALKPAAPEPVEDDPRIAKVKATGDRSGVVIPIQGMAGGVGSTTYAVNLAWELANIDADNPPRVCLIDLDLQFGSVSTALDLPRREAVLEILTETNTLDADTFVQALLTYEEKLHVLTAPAEMVPLDLIGPEDVSHIIETARTNFDYVVIDMPTVVVEWTQAVLEAAHVYFGLLELDMRCAHNTLRLKRMLTSEDLPFNKLRFLLNRGPKFTDLGGKARVKQMAQRLGIGIDVMLPDGGKVVLQNNDHGVPLGVAQPKNALRKEILKLAKQVHEINAAEAEA